MSSLNFSLTVAYTVVVNFQKGKSYRRSDYLN